MKSADRIVIDKAGTHFFLDGAEVPEKVYRGRYPAPDDGDSGVGGNRPWSRPLKSVALAVHPSQVQEAAADAEAKGVPTDFTEDGRPEFRDREHRKRYMRAYGYYDRDAGYGDAAPLRHKGKTPPPSRLRELARRLAARIRVRAESRRD